MGIRQQFTAPYTPQENTTERANRIVNTMIAQFALQDLRNWDEKLRSGSELEYIGIKRLHHIVSYPRQGP